MERAAFVRSFMNLAGIASYTTGIRPGRSLGGGAAVGAHPFWTKAFRDLEVVELNAPCDFAWIGLDCSTWGPLGSPAHGRSDRCLEGTTAKAQEANEDLRSVVRWIRTRLAADPRFLFCIENPLCPPLLRMPELRQLLDLARCCHAPWGDR